MHENVKSSTLRLEFIGKPTITASVIQFLNQVKINIRINVPSEIEHLPTYIMETNPTTEPPTASSNWRLYFELLSFTGFVIPFGQILGPLVLWLIKKDTDPSANFEGKKVINFNLSWVLWSIVSCGLGIIAWIVLIIIATIKAANNQPFKHPWTIQFLK